MDQDRELYVYRRHLRTCQFFGRGGREIRSDKCRCPFHIDGLYAGRRIRSSLKTSSRHTADIRQAELIRRLKAEIEEQAQKREWTGVRLRRRENSSNQPNCSGRNTTLPRASWRNRRGRRVPRAFRIRHVAEVPERSSFFGFVLRTDRDLRGRRCDPGHVGRLSSATEDRVGNVESRATSLTDVF